MAEEAEYKGWLRRNANGLSRNAFCQAQYKLHDRVQDQDPNREAAKPSLTSPRAETTNIAATRRSTIISADAPRWSKKYERPLLSQNLNPDVLMMQPTQNWYGCDGAELLRAPKIRRILVQ